MSSKLEDSEILHLASLARVSLDQSELEQFRSQLPKIVNFVAALGQVSHQSVEQAARDLSLSELRDDTVGSESLSIEDLAALAPEFEDDQVVVPPVLGENSDV